AVHLVEGQALVGDIREVEAEAPRQRRHTQQAEQAATAARIDRQDLSVLHADHDPSAGNGEKVAAGTARPEQIEGNADLLALDDRIVAQAGQRRADITGIELQPEFAALLLDIAVDDHPGAVATDAEAFRLHAQEFGHHAIATLGKIGLEA